MTSNSWTGGFIRLTRVLIDGLDYIVWIRASSIFQLMVTTARIQQVKDGPIENTIVTVIASGYQGVPSEMWVREGPDVILAMMDAVIADGAMSVTSEK